MSKREPVHISVAIREALAFLRGRRVRPVTPPANEIDASLRAEERKERGK